MLFRRFGIVTLSFMLAGILLAQAVGDRHRMSQGISVENRLQLWEKFEQKRACERDAKLCFAADPNFQAA